MKDNPVASIDLESHNNDCVYNGSALSTKTETNRSVVITPNPIYVH